MLDRLFTRFDEVYLASRMRKQVDLWVQLFGEGEGRIHFENIDWIFPLIRLGLQAAGLWNRAMANATDFVVTRNEFRVPRLPPAFDGLRVLHLSDVHIDVDVDHGYQLGFVEKLAAAVEALAFDLCVITGDYRFRTHGRYDHSVRQMERLLPSLACEWGVYGILGNHDFVEQVVYLEHAGLRLLINESVVLEREGQQLWLAGVDDPHLYGTHDLETTLAQVPREGCVIALIHSPEVAAEAEMNGCSLYLAGHTHGGQLCLPGGFAPYVNARCPRSRVAGRWRHGRMEGYTSAGTGSSGLPVRLNRPPEIALHLLRRG